MDNCNPALQNSVGPILAGRQLRDVCDDWLIHGDLEGWSPRTLDDRREWLNRLQEFLKERNLAFDANGLRAFFLALSRGAADARCRKPLKPASIKHVHTLLKAFGAWIVEEDFLPESPMRRIPAPILRDDGIDPFSDEELTFTFRLPPVIRELIGRLYRLDDIALDGFPIHPPASAPVASGGSWEQVWRGETGLFLVTHNETSKHGRRWPNWSNRCKQGSVIRRRPIYKLPFAESVRRLPEIWRVHRRCWL